MGCVRGCEPNLDLHARRDGEGFLGVDRADAQVGAKQRDYTLVLLELGLGLREGGGDGER